MKSLFVVTLLLFVAGHAIAQWNPNNQTAGNIFYTGGNVGIGTTAPSFLLDVRGSANGNVAFFGNDLSQVNSPFPSQVSVWGTGVNSESRIGFGTTLPGGTTGHTAMIKSVVPGNGGGHLVFQTREPNYNSLVERLLITNSGNIGIGTSTPNTLLAVSGNAEDLLHLSKKTNAAGDNVYMVFSHGDNTASANARAKIGVNIKPGGAGRLVFHTGYSNTLIEQMRIDEVGNVGIGTNNPTQKLTVNGTVYSKEVKVDVYAGTGPDYVFEPTYQLPSLTEIESYIKANKHLPEVPSAKEMETNGINLSEMNMLLLKKVEELTLHLIEATKKIEKQQMQIDTLNKIVYEKK